MRVACNSTALIALSRIGYLWLLEGQFGELMIPLAVYDDVAVKGKGKPGAKDVAEAAWIQVEEVRDVSQIERFSPVLHRGEAEAIALAGETNADLIILDDGRARKAAKAMGLNVTGTLAILCWARQRGLIPELRPILDDLRVAGFHIGAEYDEILKDAGEII